MEILLHYVWKHRLYPLHTLATVDGKPIEIIDPGIHNLNDGPDFFNAKIRIDGEMWVGNVEIHTKASEWNLHAHHTDPAYDNVILHVVEVSDCRVTDSKAKTVEQMEMPIPAYVEMNYAALLSEDRFPPCHNIIPSLSRLSLLAWTTALQTERLEEKTQSILQRVRQRNGSWEDAYFITLARSFGFGVNGNVFEQWADQLALDRAVHHRDDPFQVEAMFLGQAGLLDEALYKEKKQPYALTDNYFKRIRKEYEYLRHKFQLTNIDGRLWRYLGLRPQNFPQIRISQLANLYCTRQTSLRQLVESKDADAIKKQLTIATTEYWETHYSFGKESRRTTKRLSDASAEVLVINTAIPVMFAYGKERKDESLCERALQMLDSLKAESNSVTKLWSGCGLDIRTAADSQAAVQLKTRYCDHRECLRCRIGYEFIKNSGWFVKDNDE